jgi:hypothetical protein
MTGRHHGTRRAARAIVGAIVCAIAAGCFSSPGPSTPAAGRYAFARSGVQLMAIPLDVATPALTAVATLSAEPDFALPVERFSDPANGRGRYHDLILFNGGRVFYLSGLTDGVRALAAELDPFQGMAGAPVRACGPAGGPDDPAIGLIRDRRGEAVAEVTVRFDSRSGCIAADGDRVLAIVPGEPPGPMGVARSAAGMVPAFTQVLMADDVRVGQRADGLAIGVLRLAGPDLLFIEGVGQAGPVRLAPAPSDDARIIGWRVLARDVGAVVLCARVDASDRCALYRFDPLADPRLRPLTSSDHLGVQMAGIAAGSAFVVSDGPAVSADPPPFRMRTVHVIDLVPPFGTRAAFSLAPGARAIAIDRSVLFHGLDTVRFSEYWLIDVLTGASRLTERVMYGSGASSLYADQRIGCVVADARAASPEQSDCQALAWASPNDARGAADRQVYLADPGGTLLASHAFAAVLSFPAFVGLETASDLLIGVNPAAGGHQVWRVPKDGLTPRALLLADDAVLYGTILVR